MKHPSLRNKGNQEIITSSHRQEFEFKGGMLTCLVFLLLLGQVTGWTLFGPQSGLIRQPDTHNAQHRAQLPEMGILKGIHPLLTAELLYVLRSAGHGDVIAVVDANFPAASVGADTVYEDSVVLAGAGLPETLEAISSHLPLDLFIAKPVARMVPSPGLEMPPLGQEVQSEALAALEASSPGVLCEDIERFDFYEREATGSNQRITPLLRK